MTPMAQALHAQTSWAEKMPLLPGVLGPVSGKEGSQSLPAQPFRPRVFTVAQACALVKGYSAFLKFKEGTSPSSRLKAFEESKCAEDEFITARLKAWAEVLKSN